MRDVLLERVRQVDELGYTPEHDMQHTPGSLLAYGHAMIFPPGVPFDPAGYEPSRAELVRAAACALAAIARYDADNTTNTDQEEAHE